MTSEVLHLLIRLAHAVKDRITWPVQRMRNVAAQTPGLPLLLLAALIFLAIRTLRGDRWSALALVPLSLAWLVFNGPLEGPILLVISSSHGITLSDLFSVACLGLAAWRLAPVVLRSVA
ncbi:MAG TPA: hypothetical protein VHN80_01635 [Kineosporiaceae bacterium]|jgi:hypothetical protein|nr:hypothetical protein [Kineosporiaceae bacterium]